MLLLYITLFFLTPTTCSSLDTIAVFQNITDGETIVSKNKRFELGFFSPGTSINRYFGIWFKDTSPLGVIWIANRETPLTNTMGMVKLDRRGVLSLVNDNTIIWSSSSSASRPEENPLAQLLDTGNLVIKSGISVLWQSFNLTLATDFCSIIYGLCGPYGTCSTRDNIPMCGCLKGFLLRNNWASGCVRRVPLKCGAEEGFVKYSHMKLPVNAIMYNESLSLRECRDACKNNCTCSAYATPNINPEGCWLWFGDLIDIRMYPQSGQDLYVRLAASELSDIHSSMDRKKRVVVASSISAGSLAMLGLIWALYIWSKRKWRSDTGREGRTVKVLDKDHNSSSKNGSNELAVFSLSRISKATDNFSIANQLGEGGFGPVYKGVLEEGLEIAVKRLSKSSRQGLDEFENEVKCIAKLQHRNLVKLLGYCIQRDEKMLVYEYMHNKSLDWFIFDDLRKSLLDWPQRFHIINGIARGLLYLHQDSRLRVVHRDLKAGNILLDDDLNPKISDFGLARMFKGHENEANTKRVVGTLGYISPEYAVNGLFSVKSDIFSFGVLVLEIVSGKKNTSFAHENHHDYLLGYAWRLYKEGKSLDLIDTSLGKAYSVSEVLRSVHIGLLCVQQRAEDRPTTASVVSMLGGEGSLPSPKQPGFFIQGSENGSTSNLPLPSSINGVTLSQLEGR